MTPAPGAGPTGTINGGQLTQSLRRAAVWATLAPSLYNTQPWKIELSRGQLRLFFDYSRYLPRHDPDGRQLTISCGCALFNVRTALAHDGYAADVVRLPEGGPFTTAAIVVPSAHSASTAGPSDDLKQLSSAVLERRTNRRPFAAGTPGRETTVRLQTAAAQEGAVLMHLQTPAQQQVVRDLHHEAAQITAQDPAYRAEHRAWAATAGLMPTSSEQSISEEAAEPGVPGGPALLLLASLDDDPAAWLRAGEALERILLQVTVAGFVASLSSQVTQVPSTRDRLQLAFGLATHPLVLMQVGTALPGPHTRRRRLVDAVIDNLEDRP